MGAFTGRMSKGIFKALGHRLGHIETGTGHVFVGAHASDLSGELFGAESLQDVPYHGDGVEG